MQQALSLADQDAMVRPQLKGKAAIITGSTSGIGLAG